MKFNLIVNEKHNDGFKLTFQEDNEKEMVTCKELAEKLIEKIKSIEVKVTSDEYWQNPIICYNTDTAFGVLFFLPRQILIPTASLDTVRPSGGISVLISK